MYIMNTRIKPCRLCGFRGHHIIADITTMNNSSFRSLNREDTAMSHTQYADQLTIYAQSLRGYHEQEQILSGLEQRQSLCC